MKWPQWVKDDKNILEISKSIFKDYVKAYNQYFSIFFIKKF